MKKYIYLIIILLTYSVFVSCDSFLDIKPDGEVVNNVQFDGPDGFEEALYGVYSTLASDNLYAKNLTFYLTDVVGQYLYPSWTGNSMTHLCVYEYLHQDVRPTIDLIWSTLYNNIANVNNILENLEKKDPQSMQLYNVYKGESLALRAFMHFELARYYCDNIINDSEAVGLPYRESYSYNVYKFEPLRITYEKIIRDLKMAEELMADTEVFYNNVGENMTGFVLNREIHLSIDAVKALLARVYWTMGDLKMAADYALQVVNTGRYECVDDTEIEDMMNGVLSPKETIFGLYSMDKYHLATMTSLYYSSGNETYVVKENFEDWYNADRDGFDSRREKWLKNLSDFGADGLRLVKVLDWYRVKQKVRPDSRVRGINMIRIPEMYYILAEYHLELEEFADAHRYFDAVIKKRGLKPYAQREGMKLSIKNLNIERCKEYIGEGQYFHVMKRYNMDGYDLTTDKLFKASEGIFIFPIPQAELDFNPIEIN